MPNSYRKSPQPSSYEIEKAAEDRQKLEKIFNTTWVQRVADNLLPLSEERHNLALAIREWIYRGVMNDLNENQEGGEDEGNRADCELCDHPSIRYQFQIENKNNSHQLLIGSECITRFDNGIGVVDNDGQIIKGASAKKKVAKDRNKLIQRAKTRDVVNTLVKLGSVDNTFEFDSFIRQYQEKGSFSPKQISTLVWRLNVNNISFDPKNFKMSMKRNDHKAQLAKMPDWKLNQIWHCFSNSQLAWVEKMRKKQNRDNKK